MYPHVGSFISVDKSSLWNANYSAIRGLTHFLPVTDRHPSQGGCPSWQINLRFLLMINGCMNGFLPPLANTDTVESYLYSIFSFQSEGNMIFLDSYLLWPFFSSLMNNLFHDKYSWTDSRGIPWTLIIITHDHNVVCLSVEWFVIVSLGALYGLVFHKDHYVACRDRLGILPWGNVDWLIDWLISCIVINKDT